MEFIRYLSLVGMILWSLVHILISPHFLEEEMFIHAAIIITWGEILLILAHKASSETWFREKIVLINTLYALVYLFLAFLYYNEVEERYTSFVLFVLGVGKLYISLVLRDDWSAVVLLIVCAITGAIQSVLLLSDNTFVPYTDLFPVLGNSLIPIVVDVVFFVLSVWLAIFIIDRDLAPSAILMFLFLIFGIVLIGAGTWSAYMERSWIISSLIIGKGVISISVSAFTR